MISQSRRRPLLRPSPGWMQFLVIIDSQSHLSLSVPSRGLLRDCEIFANLRITFVWSSITTVTFPPVSARGVAWSVNKYEESRCRQTSLTGLDRDRQLAHSHLRYNTDFFLRCLSATAQLYALRHRPVLCCRVTRINIIRSLWSRKVFEAIIRKLSRLAAPK